VTRGADISNKGDEGAHSYLGYICYCSRLYIGPARCKRTMMTCKVWINFMEQTNFEVLIGKIGVV